MNQLFRYMKGYVCIRVRCEHPERFMRLCAFHGIRLFHVIPNGNSYEMEMELDSFFRLQPVCRKEKSHIHILKKTGMPFFLMKQRKRKAFFIGLLLGAFLLFLASTRIWNIHIEGNRRYPTGNLLQALAEAGVEHGTSKQEIKTHQVAAFLREEFPEIIWVSAQMKGTRFLLTIQENLDPAMPDEGENTSCDLVAEESGVIVSILARQGVPLFHAGEQCRKGDILISGEVPIVNDEKEVTRRKPVMADGDVYIQRQIAYQDSFALRYVENIETGRCDTAYGVQMGSVLLGLHLGKHSFLHYNSVSTLYELRLTENFYLPIYLEKKETREYEKKKYVYSEEEAVELAQKQEIKFLNKLSEKGMKIMKNNVKIAIQDGNCVSEGTILVIDQIGRKAALTTQEEKERTLANE